MVFCLLSCMDAYSQVSTAMLDHVNYRNIGPARGGRVTTVAGVIQRPGTFYMGATGGGVWKTTDYGITWGNVSDGFIPTPSIGAIRVAPSDPEVVYVGTGSDGLRSNVIAGKGVFRSNDGGQTWDDLGLHETGHIGAVEVHPEDANVAYVAAIGNAFMPNKERGIYKTTDGGTNWEKVLYLSDTVGFSDLELHPTNPAIIYAGAWRGERKPWTIISGGKVGGIYRSQDGGASWQKLTDGLPSDLIGKIDLAVSAHDPQRVYALIEAPVGDGGLYRSDDAGDSWTLISTFKPLLDRPFYYCNVDVDPNDADKVLVSSTQFWVSENAGENWKRMATPHGDNHEVWIHPNDPMLWVQCNDGGANVTRDGGKNWSTQLNQSTAELYQVEVDDAYPYRLYAGQQDNWTTISVPSLPPSYAPVERSTILMEATGGCETGPAVPKPGNPNIVYSNCKGRFGVYDRRTGQERQYYVGAQFMYGHNPSELAYRFQRVSPIHVSPHDPNVVYHCSQFVHKTQDEGVTWETISPDLTAFEPERQVISGAPITRDITGEEFYSTIYAIQESKISKGLIWVGANDGPVHVTQDGGASWTNVTPDGLLTGGRVDAVEPSVHDPAKAYIAVLRYQLGDFKPYIYRTNDYGNTWTLLTNGDNGLPDGYPTRVIREDPNQEGLLYAGTEYGMFISFNDGESWQSFNQNLPVTPITDIKIHEQDLVLSTMGRGFWIVDDITPLYELSGLGDTPALLPIRDAYRTRYRSGAQVPQYPRSPMRIHYYLPEDVTGHITLEVVDEKGKVVRSFSTKSVKESMKAAGERDMATGFIPQGYSGALKKKAGLHRFYWDMRHTGAWDSRSSRSGQGGPMAAPGNYKVRLEMDGWSAEQSFVLMSDPRLEAAGITTADLIAQENLALRVRDLNSKAKQLSYAVNQEIKEAEKAKNGEKEDALKQLHEGLVTQEGRYMKNMLLSQIGYLNGMLNRADQKPGQDGYARYETLKKYFQTMVAQWEDISEESSDHLRIDE